MKYLRWGFYRVLRLFGRLSSFRQIMNALISSIIPGGDPPLAALARPKLSFFCTACSRSTCSTTSAAVGRVFVGEGRGKDAPVMDWVGGLRCWLA